MKKFFALCFLALFMASPVMAHSSHQAPARTVVPSALIMIHHKDCHFCKAFMRDIGVEKYNATNIGTALPLRVFDVSTPEGRKAFLVERRAGRISPRVRGTPTFIIYYNNKEVGRVTGYAGKEWFYRKLNAEVKRAFEALGGIPWISKIHAPK